MLNIPRDYQKSILETAKKNNTLVVLPTGLGKTLIALLLAVEKIKQRPGSKILFLAPTRPLVEQHLESFKSQLPELFADLQLFTGSVSAPQRKKIWQTAEIIFSTPQCIANDLNNYLYNLQDVSLLIIDEAHRCLKNYDYTKVVEFYKQQSHFPHILGLTASPGSDSQKIEVPFPAEFMEIRILLKRIFDSCINKLREKSLLFGPANKITLLKLQARLAMQASSQNYNAFQGMSLCAQAIKISHALELLETQTLSGLEEYLKKMIKDAEQKKSKAVQTLVKTPEFNASLISISLLKAKKIEHPKIDELSALVESEFKENPKAKIIIFSQFRETASTISERLSSLSYVKSSIFVGQAKKSNSRGTSGLNQKEQKSIIDKFRTGELNVLCATSIGEEGLDIPEVSAVIFYEPIPSAIRKIQRAGRTARLSPGKLFILMTKDTRDIAHHYASSAREKKMHKNIDDAKRELKNKTPKLSDFK